MQELINVALILVWPVVCCLFFLKLETVPATFVSLVGGMLILPVKVQFDLPLIPAIDKNVSSSIGALLGIVLIHKKTINWFGSDRTKHLILAILSIPFINLFFNTSPHFTGAVWKPGLSLHESLSAVLLTYLTLLPLIIGINVVKREEDLYKILKYLVVASLLYLPLVLFELRFSPQLHNIVYGFHPHEFIQQIRAGGFRAVVFLGHGLLTANFYLGGFIALLLLSKMKRYFISRNIHLTLIVILLFCLVLLKSVTAVLLAIVAVVLLNINRNLCRKSMKLIVISAAIYPLIVFFGLIPLDWLYENMQTFISSERIESLYFRFSNEKMAIDYLGYNIFVGFGGLGRAVMDGIITDGSWLVWTLRYGAVFWFLCVFLCLKPLFCITKNSDLNRRLVLLAILPVVILIDQIPNSSWSLVWIWLYSGALIGYSESEN
jgi:hypothetical protein